MQKSNTVERYLEDEVDMGQTHKEDMKRMRDFLRLLLALETPTPPLVFKIKKVHHKDHCYIINVKGYIKDMDIRHITGTVMLPKTRGKGFSCVRNTTCNPHTKLWVFKVDLGDSQEVMNDDVIKKRLKRVLSTGNLRRITGRQVNSSGKQTVVMLKREATKKINLADVDEDDRPTVRECILDTLFMYDDMPEIDPRCSAKINHYRIDFYGLNKNVPVLDLYGRFLEMNDDVNDVCIDHTNGTLVIRVAKKNIKDHSVKRTAPRGMARLKMRRSSKK